MKSAYRIPAEMPVEEKPMKPLQNPDDEETKQFRSGARWIGLAIIAITGACGSYWMHNDQCAVETKRIELDQKRLEVEMEMWKHIPAYDASVPAKP